MSRQLVYELDCATSSLITVISPTDIETIDVILLKNLDKAASELTLIIEVPPLGTKIKIINKHYNPKVGVRVVFSQLNHHQNNYWFAFASQKKTFFFDGDEWIMSDPPHLGNIAMTLFEYEPQRGYLNLLEFTDPEKKHLFQNLNMVHPLTGEEYKIDVIAHRFFRAGKLSNLEDDAIQNIEGSLSFHSAGNLNVRPNVLEGAFYKGEPISTKYGGFTETHTENENSNAYFDASRVARTADETRPLNIAGYYIVKAF